MTSLEKQTKESESEKMIVSTSNGLDCERKQGKHGEERALSSLVSLDKKEKDGRTDEQRDEDLPPPNWAKEKRKIMLLIILYVFQALPLAFDTALSLLLIARDLPYRLITLVQAATWMPFCFKIIWAPFVDSVYSLKIGRRKSWIVPAQLIAGALLFKLSYQIEELMNDMTKIPLLCVYLFTIVCFCTLQDVAVDGWCLTYLSKENLVYAGIISTIGFSIGFTLTFSIILTFNSTKICNDYIRPYLERTMGFDYSMNRTILIEKNETHPYLNRTIGNPTCLNITNLNEQNNSTATQKIYPDEPILTLETYLFWKSLGYMALSTLIFLIKEEEPTQKMLEHQKLPIKMRVGKTYKELYRLVMEVKPLRLLMLAIVSFGIPQLPYPVLKMKYIEYGMRYEVLAFFGMVTGVLKFIVIGALSKVIATHKPMRRIVNLLPLAVICGMIGLIILQVLPRYGFDIHEVTIEVNKCNATTNTTITTTEKVAKFSWYFIITIQSFFGAIITSLIYLTMVGLFARISDPRVGGTYMTLLNTLFNGINMMLNMCTTIFIDNISTFNCYRKDSYRSVIAEFPKSSEIKGMDEEFLSSIDSWDNKKLANLCKEDKGNEWVILKDGIYVEAAITLIVGTLWLSYFKKRIYTIDTIELKKWHLD